MPRVGNGRTLVIDIGGFHNRFLGSQSRGRSGLQSCSKRTVWGFKRLSDDFEESFKSNNAEAVKDTPILPPDRVRKAIVSGVFEGGGRKYPCGIDVQMKQPACSSIGLLTPTKGWLAVH